MYIIGPGHMIKMAATSIMVKYKKKSSSPEPLGRKNLKMHFSVACVLLDMEMQSVSIPMNSRRKGHLVTLAKGHLSVFCQYFQRSFSETTGPISIKFHMQP